jgi:lysophospholipase L1-like esterase
VRSLGATALAAGATLVLLAVAASAAPASPRPLLLVAIGDSTAYGRYYCNNCTTFVRRSAHALAATTNRRVRVQNLADPGRVDSAALRARLENDERLRAAVAAANVVIVTVGRDDKPWASSTDSCDGAATYPSVDWSSYEVVCLAEDTERYETNLDAILGLIRDRRDSRRTAIRVTIAYNELIGRSQLSRAGAAVTTSLAEDYAVSTCEVALRHKADCVDILHAFNGLSGLRNAKRLLARDHTHPNARGHRLIARLLVRDGFAPLARR